MKMVIRPVCLAVILLAITFSGCAPQNYSEFEVVADNDINSMSRTTERVFHYNFVYTSSGVKKCEILTESGLHSIAVSNLGIVTLPSDRDYVEYSAVIIKEKIKSDNSIIKAGEYNSVLTVYYVDTEAPEN